MSDGRSILFISCSLREKKKKFFGLQVVVPQPSESFNCDALNTQPKKKARSDIVVSHYICMHLVNKLYNRRMARVLPRIFLRVGDMFIVCRDY